MGFRMSEMKERYSRVYKTEAGYLVECYDDQGIVFADNKTDREQADAIAKNWITDDKE